tara:strand:- start:139 stop:516 length:378 start_codon:yes stop_codon:yes gene_type:complete
MSSVEILAQRVELLEKQLADMLKNNNTDTKDKQTQTSKKQKTSKKDSPKKERVKSTTGYIQYSNAHRDEVKELLASETDEKPKNTDIMRQLASNWKQLSVDDKAVWNEKAKELNVQYKAEAVEVA